MKNRLHRPNNHGKHSRSMRLVITAAGLLIFLAGLIIVVIGHVHVGGAILMLVGGAILALDGFLAYRDMQEGRDTLR
jgi:hypothetical protein